jgi:translation initiation factor IF-3
MMAHIEFNLDSDLAETVRAAEERLRSGAVVERHLKFRGREMAHTAIGAELFRRALFQLATSGRLDSEPKLIGRNMRATLSPLR